MVKGDRDVTQAHINQMPYLKAFVRETFRVWPNGTEVSRYTEKDMVSSGFISCHSKFWHFVTKYGDFSSGFGIGYELFLGCVKLAF